MLINYFKIAIRVFTRQKLFSVINTAGLAIGLASALLIALYVRHELNFDRSFSKADRIYRVAATLHLESGPSVRAVTSPPMAGIIRQEIPEVEKVLRIGRSFRPLSVGDKTFLDLNLLTSDSSFFDFFDFPLLAGNPSTALAQPNAVVLTEETARKYFGTADALGKQMALSDTITLTVTGIIGATSEHTHLSFDALYSRTTLVKPHEERTDNWFQNGFYTYVLLNPSASPESVVARFPEMLDKHMGADRKKSIWYELFLQSVTDIHLHSSLRAEMKPNSNMSIIYTFGSIAFFILLVASINFMNLSTAKATKRANEIGIRKAAGALRIQLVGQFLAESLLLVTISAVAAIVLAQTLLPTFNGLIEKRLSLDFLRDPGIVLGLMVVTISVALLAGLYPALVLSRFKPIQVLKGKIVSGPAGSIFRKSLVVLQFSISIVLISGAIIIQDQINFMQNQELGFTKEQLLVVSLRGTEGTSKYEVIKQRLLQNASIQSVSATAEPLGRGQSVIATLPEGWTEDQITSVTTIMCDADFLKTHQIQLAAGRDFVEGSQQDADHGFIVNESAVKMFGWKDNDSAIGKKLDWGLGKEGEVIGVVKDFHYVSLHRQVEPLIIHMDPGSFSYLTVRVAPGKNDWQSTLTSLDRDWKSLGMKGQLEYFFLDEDFARQYAADEQMKNMVTGFSLLAIFIGCLGLYGLAAYSTEQRGKEIGIRRVMGASVPNLVKLLTVDFLKLVVLANLIAWPVAWYLLRQWLSDFAFHIEPGIWVFALSGLIALVIAWLPVGIESMKAATVNPVKSLRNDG